MSKYVQRYPLRKSHNLRMSKYALPKCALPLRYLLSSSPCQGNTASHHHLRPLQTFPWHQYASCIYMLPRGVKCFAKNVLRKVSFVYSCTLYCLFLILCIAWAWRSLRPGSWLQIWQNWLLIPSFSSTVVLQLSTKLFIGSQPSIIHSSSQTQHVADAWINSQNLEDAWRV